MRPGDRMICAFIHDPILSHFKNWPLHVTIVPWFRANIQNQVLSRQLSDSLKGVGPFEANTRKRVKLGRNRSKTAILIEEPSVFTEIEKSARKLLKENNAWLVDETTKRKANFLPHVTDQGSNKLEEGQSFWCKELYIIEQRGEYKEVTGVIKLQ